MASHSCAPRAGSQRKPLGGRLALYFLTALFGLVLMSCGGGGLGSLSPEASRPVAWPGHNFEGAQNSGGFSLVAMNGDESAIDSRTTASLRLQVSPLAGGGSHVEIYGAALEPSDRAFLHLKYNAAGLHPVKTEEAAPLADSTVFLGVSDYPGIVALGLVGMGGTRTLSGDGLLASVDFASGAMSAGRKVSTVTGTTVNDLHFDATNTDNLVWSYRCQGDYDQSGQVRIADLTPIGIYFGAHNTDNNWAQAVVADGNNDGVISVQDLTPIGINFLFRCDAYQIGAGGAETGPFSPGDTVQYSESTAPVGGGFRQFSHPISSPVDGAWYVVSAVDNGSSSTAANHSNAVQYSSGAFAAPTDLTAVNNAGQIQLNWQAPVGDTPDGYFAFVSDSITMAGAQQINLTTISGTTFDCPLAVDATQPHFFAVKAAYGPSLSGYSNVYNYSPVGAAPTGLTALKNGSFLTLTWTPPGTGTPEGYNAYVDDANSDMSAALKINLAAITNNNFDCPLAVSPDSPHYFGVKAIYNGEESGYSNIYFYQPGNPNDTDPPTWDNAAEIGIKSAIPGDTTVSIEWYTASDSGSPPVTYQIFYAPTATGINWSGSPQETSGAGTTAKVISGLTNGTSYDFGVRAVDGSSNATTNTNFLSATPVGGGTPVDSGVWQTPELVDDGGVVPHQDYAFFNSIAIDPAGNLAISFYNNTSQDLMVTTGTAGNWSTETVISEGDVGLFSDAEFDPVSGDLCVAFHNSTEASLNFARKDKVSGVWSFEQVDSGGDQGAFCDLEFDPTDNQPAIAYLAANAYDVKYAKYNGTSWSKSVAYNGSNAGLGLTGQYLAMAFDPNTGFPGIAFCKNFDGLLGGLDMDCWVTQYNGSSWTPEEVFKGPDADIGIELAGFRNSIGYDGDGFCYVMTEMASGEIYICENTQGSWTANDTGASAFTLDDLLNGNPNLTFNDVDLLVQADGTLQWVYYDITGGAYYGLGLATDSIVENTPDNVGGFPCLRVQGNAIHVAYMDVTNKNLRYSKKVGAGNWAPELAAEGLNIEGVTGERASLLFNPSPSFPCISYYDVSNSALRYADKQPGSWRKETVANDRIDGAYSQMAQTSSGVKEIVYFSIALDGSFAGIYVANGSFANWSIDPVWEVDIAGGEVKDVLGAYCSIANSGQPNDLPGISYFNQSNPGVAFGLGDGGGSYQLGSVDSNNNAGRWSSAGFNPDVDRPAVAYYERDFGDLFYAEQAQNGTWTPVSVDTAQDVGNHCSMVFSPTGNPWISYYNSTAKKLKVAYLSSPPSPSWHNFSIDAPGGSTDYGIWSSMAWHPLHNRPAVAFYDSASGKLWYVFIGDPAAPQAAVEVGSVPDAAVGSNCSLAFDSATNQPSIAYQDVTNGDLYYVERHSS